MGNDSATPDMGDAITTPDMGDAITREQVAAVTCRGTAGAGGSPPAM